LVIKTEDDLRDIYDHLEQLLATHEKYKKNILGRLEGLVLCGNAHTHPDYVTFFGDFHID
jgi:hypothetical protein